MPCSSCGSPTVSFSVPSEFRDYAPESAAAAAICTRCLTVEPAEVADGSDGSDTPGGSDTWGAPDTPNDSDATAAPDFSQVSDAFPTGEAAVPFALAIGLASSIATNRSALEKLLSAVERSGADPLLALDRLAGDPSIDAAIDLDRRAHQLEQLLY